MQCDFKLTLLIAFGHLVLRNKLRTGEANKSSGKSDHFTEQLLPIRSRFKMRGFEEWRESPEEAYPFSYISYKMPESTSVRHDSLHLSPNVLLYLVII